MLNNLKSRLRVMSSPFQKLKYGAFTFGTLGLVRLATKSSNSPTVIMSEEVLYEYEGQAQKGQSSPGYKRSLRDKSHKYSAKHMFYGLFYTKISAVIVI